MQSQNHPELRGEQGKEASWNRGVRADPRGTGRSVDQARHTRYRRRSDRSDGGGEVHSGRLALDRAPHPPDGETAVGRGDRLDIHRERLGAADPLELLQRLPPRLGAATARGLDGGSLARPPDPILRRCSEISCDSHRGRARGFSVVSRPTTQLHETEANRSPDARSGSGLAGSPAWGVGSERLESPETWWCWKPVTH